MSAHVAVRRWMAALLCGVALAGCSTTEKPKPAPLEAFAPKLTVATAWQRSVGRPVPGLQVVALADRFVLATEAGQILVLDARSGAETLRIDVGAPLSAGVGSDGRFHAVVTRDNELVVFEGARALWRKRLGARVVTAPLVAGERVFLQGTDRVVTGYDAVDGRLLWTFSRAGDPLALSQPGVLLPFKDTLLVGVGPRLVGIEPLLGSVRSETALATPRGTNEVERLADLVAPAARLGDVVCARAFQAAVACANVERGAVLWSRNAGGYHGVSSDADNVYGADASDRITAWKRASGETAWTSERLRYRGLGAPLALDGAVVFGDAEGYLHFLSRERGDLLQRLPTDGSGLPVPLVRAGSMVLAITRSGQAHAFRAP